MVTPVAIRTIAWRYYLVFVATGVCIPVSVYFFFLETRGRNLEEIDLMFRESPSVWGTVNFARSRPIGTPQEFTTDKSGEDDFVEDQKEHAA